MDVKVKDLLAISGDKEFTDKEFQTMVNQVAEKSKESLFWFMAGRKPAETKGKI